MKNFSFAVLAATLLTSQFVSAEPTVSQTEIRSNVTQPMGEPYRVCRRLFYLS